MAETREILIELKADTASALENIRKFRAENERLREQMKANKKAIQETADHYDEASAEEIAQMNKLIDENEKLTAAVKQNNQAIQDNVKVVELQVAQDRKSEKMIAVKEKSLRELRAEAAALTRQYESMSGADRVGEVGQRVARQLKQVNEQIRTTTFEVGNFKDNIGNYVSALQGLPGPVGQSAQGLGLLQNGIGGVNKSFKALLANPILLVLGTLISLLVKAADAIKSNEEYSDRLSTAFSSLNPIIDMISNAFDKLAGYLVQIAEFFGEVVNKIAGTSEEAKEAVKQAQELRKAEIDLAKQERAFKVESAKADKEVADLRAKAADKEKHTNQERLAYLDKAIAIETDMAIKRKRMAEERLRLLRLESDRTANDAAANNELAEAEAAVLREEQALANKTRELNSQRMEAIKAIKAEEKAIAEVFVSVAQNEQKRRVEAAKARLTDLEQANADYARIEEQAMLLRFEREMQLEADYEIKMQQVRDNEVYTEEAKNALILDLRADLNVKLEGLNNDYLATLSAAQDREEAQLAAHLAKEAELVKANAEAEAKAKAAAEKSYQDKRKAILSAGATFSAQINDELAQQSKVAFEAKKAADIANAITSTYQAATGSYAALAEIPIVGPALGAAAAAAAVASGIINVKNIASTRFGSTSAGASGSATPNISASGASTAAAYSSGNVNSGATLAALQSPSAPTTGSSTTNIITGMTEAIRQMPAPVVSVTEFESVQGSLNAKRAQVRG